MSVLYFAYGSNLATRRLRSADRSPNARPVGVAELPDFELRFHKRGTDGSGKGNAFPLPGSRLWGVVYELPDRDLARLDVVEGLGTGYDRQSVRVTIATESLEATTYVALPGAIDEAILPASWYLDWLIEGALEHGLPSHWVARLRSQNCLGPTE